MCGVPVGGAGAVWRGRVAAPAAAGDQSWDNNSRRLLTPRLSLSNISLAAHAGASCLLSSPLFCDSTRRGPAGRQLPDSYCLGDSHPFPPGSGRPLLTVPCFTGAVCLPPHFYPCFTACASPPFLHCLPVTPVSLALPHRLVLYSVYSP